MKSIISYASGGLANRLLPLSSCLSYARRKKIKPIICWEKTWACDSSFQSLFEMEENEIEVIEKNELLERVDALFYLNASDVYQDCFLYGNDTLKKIYENANIKKYPLSLFSDNLYKNCCVYSNNFINSIEDIELSKTTLKSIPLSKNIQEKINTFCLINNVNENWIGIHARGTDFCTNLSTYEKIIEQSIQENPQVNIFFCSDEPSWEMEMFEKYEKNIAINIKEEKVKLLNPNNKSWINNTFRSENQVKDGLVDIVLLSKCGKIFGNKESSFYKLAVFMKTTG